MCILTDIEEIYSLIPDDFGSTCKRCGKCCVVPPLTYIEFLYIRDNVSDRLLTSALKQRPSHRKDNASPCPFLVFNSVSECKIYPFRPFVCRTVGRFNVPNIGEVCSACLEPEYLKLSKKIKKLNKRLQLPANLRGYKKLSVWIKAGRET